MAKGSNNPRSRASDASKPYNVQNSFVKRVTSRVSELLPQPSSWFSRWMSPASVTNSSEFINHTTSTVTSRPPATSRAELNLVSTDDIDHQIPAKRARTNQYGSPVNQNKFLKNDGYGTEDLSPIAVRGETAAVAGPSSAQPEFIASTPAVTVQQTQTSSKVNGDDCSETSESTSGCSSLVPQAQSTIRSLGGSRFGHSLGTGMNVDSLHRRRPSFSTTTFASPLRSSMRERLGSSPFYSGRTMYGGSAQAYVSMIHSPQRRVGPTVKPAPSTQQSLPLSSTAKRILDALEQFSSPVIDAKRIPVAPSTGTKRKLDVAQRYPELSIPSTPDLLRVKRRERLQQSTSAARQTAMAAVPVPPAADPPAPPRQYTLRQDDSEKKKTTGKVKTKEVVAEESVEQVSLPPVVLSVDKLPKIDIAVKPPAPVSVCKPSETLSVSKITATSSTKFTFSSPTVIPVTVPCTSTVPTSMFKFSAPLGESSVSVSRTISDSAISPNKKTKDNQSSAGIDIKSAMSTLNALANTTTSISVQSSLSECKKCKAKLKNNKCSLCEKSENNCEKSTDGTKSGFGDLLKKQTGGTWECSVCMIRNKNEATKCVACESSKPTPKPVVSEVKSVPSPMTTPGTGFGDKFKKPTGSWECDACMVRNEPSCEKCVACETPKPGAKAVPNPLSTSSAVKTSSSFGDMFKKPTGSWSCDVCMITNSSDKVKCAACETPKPGATIPKPSETPGPKFSFGIPSSTTSLSSPSAPTFSFGVNAADKDKTSNQEDSTTKEKSQAPLASQTFSFGIPKSAKIENETSSVSSSSSNATFQFGSSSTKAADSKFSFGTMASSEKLNTNDKCGGTGGVGKKRGLEDDSKSDAVKSSFSPAKPSLSVSKAETEPTKILINETNKGASLNKPALTAASPIFSFGSTKTVQSSSDKSSDNPVTKPPQNNFMFDNKQGSFPSSTTNTLSTSVSSNVFKFGETKTVPSGTSYPSVSAVSSQPTSTAPVSKPNNMFAFGSSGSTDKKVITFETPKPLNNQPVVNASGPATENKPSFGPFGASNPPSFGSTSTNTFGTSSFGSKEQPSNFLPQTTNTGMFGMSNASSTTQSTSFQTFGQNAVFTSVTQENKPSAVFTFGSTVSKEAAPAATPVGGFAFEPNVEKPAAPVFNFGAQPNTTGGFNNSTPATGFNFEPKPFSAAPFGASNNVTPVFGASTAQATPTFGDQATNNAPVFAFGAQNSQPTPTPAASMFNFTANQNTAPAQPAAASTFMFGANSTPAQSTFSANPAPPPQAFDPNIKPTFNFTQGTPPPMFSAVPTVNSTATAQGQRKIRKAVRRSTNISSVRQN